MRRIAVLSLLAMLAVAPAAHAGLITNGSFESGTYANGGSGYETLLSGSSAITGWTITTGSVDWIDTYWQAADGRRSIDLNGNSLGGMAISTPLITVPGQLYLLTFDLAGNPDSGPVVKTMTVTVGNTSANFSFDTTSHTKTNMGWTLQSLMFTGTGADNLSFTSTTTTYGPYYGPALDNVAVTAVPEPATLSMLALGLAGVWRRRRAGR